MEPALGEAGNAAAALGLRCVAHCAVQSCRSPSWRLISASFPPRLQSSVGAAPESAFLAHRDAFGSGLGGLRCFHWVPASVLLWEEGKRAGVSHSQQVHGLYE